MLALGVSVLALVADLLIDSVDGTLASTNRGFGSGGDGGLMEVGPTRWFYSKVPAIRSSAILAILDDMVEPALHRSYHLCHSHWATHLNLHQVVLTRRDPEMKFVRIVDEHSSTLTLGHCQYGTIESNPAFSMNPKTDRLVRITLQVESRVLIQSIPSGLLLGTRARSLHGADRGSER